MRRASKRGRGARLTSTPTTGRTGMRNSVSVSIDEAQARLERLVNDLPVNEELQRQLDEETVELELEFDSISGVEDEFSDSESSNTAQETVESKPPPGVPIPAFTISTWKASWRRIFFKDWRQEPNLADPSKTKVFAQCKTGECDRSNRQKYFRGGVSSFTNFVTHLNSHHREVWLEYKAKSGKETEVSLTRTANQQKQLTIERFSRPISLSKAQQLKLDSGLAYSIAIDNLPLNILRRPNFRKWVEVNISTCMSPYG